MPVNVGTFRPLSLEPAIERFTAAREDARQREGQRRVLEREQATRDLMGPASMGSPAAMEQLMRTNPEMGMKLQAQLQSQAANQQQQQIRMRADASEFSQQTNEMLQRAPPEQREAILSSRLQQREQQFGGMQDQMGEVPLGERMLMGDAPKPTSRIELKTGINPDTQKEEYFTIDKDTRDKKWVGVEKPKKGPLVQIGGAEPTNPVITKIQKDLFEANRSAETLQRLEDNFNSDYLTWGGSLVSKGTDIQEKATFFGNPLLGTPSEQQKEFVKNRTEYKNDVEQFFSEYRRIITGAQAAVAELDYLRDNMLNTDMGESRFLGALRLLKTKNAAARAMQEKLLAQGFNLDSKESKDLVNRAVESVPDPTGALRDFEREADGTAKEKSVVDRLADRWLGEGGK